MKSRNLIRILAAVLAVLILCISLMVKVRSDRNPAVKESVTIFTSIEDYRIDYLQKELDQAFPNYDVNIVFYSTGSHMEKLLNEGVKTECDITHSLGYSYLQQLDSKGYLADLGGYDKAIYDKGLVISDKFLPQERGSGAVIINTQLLKEMHLKEPRSYEDLLDPKLRGLVSMPNPKDSSTGYMFYKSLVNAWGEKKALAYFDRLTDNVLQYTQSGSGPLKAVSEGKAAVGLGTTATAVTAINDSKPIKITFFKEGAPYTVYGQAIIKGKEKRKAVRDVFGFLVNNFNYKNCALYMPEKLYKDKTFTLKNYPQNIVYADMSNDTVEEKERLLAEWKY